MIKYYQLLLYLLLGQLSFAQNDVKTTPFSLNFQPQFEGQVLIIDEDLEEKELTENSSTIELLKFYISKITLQKNGQTVWEEKESYHLINAAKPSSLQLALAIPKALDFDALQFNLGIDSLTNVAGVMGGDLDPTKGMYWSWQTGYVNFKLEGRSLETPTRFNAFQFHLGGYRSPHNPLQTIVVPIKNQAKLTIKLNISELLSTIDLATQHTIMSPSEASKNMSLLIANLFKNETP